jgi:hypothetical protein
MASDNDNGGYYETARFLIAWLLCAFLPIFDLSYRGVFFDDKVGTAKDWWFLLFLFSLLFCVFVFMVKKFYFALRELKKNRWDTSKPNDFLTIEWGEYGGDPMSPKTQIWFGYPLFIASSGGFSLVMYLDLTGRTSFF